MGEGERREQVVPGHWQAERRLMDYPDDLSALSVPAMRELIHELCQRQQVALSRHEQREPVQVLLVDDEADLASAAELLLNDLGYEVSVHSNALEALALFRAEAETFDLVITDQTMPELTGRALAEAARAIRPDIPIILCTGYSHVIHAAQAEELGIDAFLMKPVESDALAETIERVLSRVRAERA